MSAVFVLQGQPLPMPLLNPHLVDTATPPIPEAQDWARRYDGKRGPLIDLSQAVPGFPPPAGLLARLAEAARSPAAARYGEIVGDAALREAYAADIAQVYGHGPTPDEVVITAGCNQAFFVAAMTVARAGDAILLPAPWYFNHKMTLDMMGIEARPLPLKASAGFVPDPEAAERLIDGTVRAIVLVTPNNPSGAVYPPEVLDRFHDLCGRLGLWLILDETYRDFLPSGTGVPHGLFGNAGWREFLIALYSFSKAYCIPGHRLGAIAAGASFVAEAAKVMDCLQICAPRAAQIALSKALPALVDWRAGNRAEITRRAEAFQRAVARLEGWRIDAIGAYFAYLRHPFAAIDASRVAMRLAEERGILALPGSYFGPGQARHLRVAFANIAVDSIEALPDRMADFTP